MTASEALCWLEDKHTLHKSVQILYVVDGYEIHMMENDEQHVVAVFHGHTLLEAITKAAKVYPLGQAKSRYEH